MSNFKKGTIARCSRNQLGIITEDKPKEIAYPDGTKGVAWVGIHLTDGDNKKIGDPWSSRNPRYVMDLENLNE